MICKWSAPFLLWKLAILFKGMLQVELFEGDLVAVFVTEWSGIEGGGKALHKLVGEYGGWLWNCVDRGSCVVTLVILGSAVSLRMSNT